SAKLRLGWDKPDPVHENSMRAAEGGASWITIHGRTRLQGYAPPAYWQPIGEVRRRLSIPVVANGDIWTREDFLRCREETGCEHFMLGRGALADPSLPVQLCGELGMATGSEEIGKFGSSTAEWLPLLERFAALSPILPKRLPGYEIRRVKQ